MREYNDELFSELAPDASFNLSTEVPRAMFQFWNGSVFTETLALLYGLWVILYRSTRELQQYKYFLLNMMLAIYILDMCISLFLRPFALFPLYGYGFATRFMHLERDLFFYFLVFMLFLINWTSLSLVNGFIYRFIVLRNFDWFNDEPKRIYCVCGLFNIVPGLIGPLSLCFCRVSEEKRASYLRQKHPQLSHLLELPYWEIFNPDLNPPYNAIMMFLIVFCLGLQVSIAAFAIKGIFRAIDRNKDCLSPTTIKMHRRLTKALIIQASVPFTIYVFPIAISFVMIFMHISNIQIMNLGISLVRAAEYCADEADRLIQYNLSAMCHLLMACVCVHSTANILLMVVFTGSYRAATVGLLGNIITKIKSLLKIPVVQVTPPIKTTSTTTNTHASE